MLESTSSVIRNDRGEPEKLIIVNRDVSERKRAEEALRRSESGFRSVVEDAPYGIYQTRADGRFLQVNPALQRMLGYEQMDELLAKDLPETHLLHKPFTEEVFLRKVREVLDSGKRAAPTELALKELAGSEKRSPR